MIDYLPQTPKLSYEFISQENTTSTSIGVTDIKRRVRIYIMDTEGLEEINVVIRNNSTGTVSKDHMNLDEINSGYYEAEISRTTTFTFKGKTENGLATEEVSIKVSFFDDPDLRIILDGNCISILASDGLERDYEFEISPVEYTPYNVQLSGFTNKSINISDLSSGIYVLKIVDVKTRKSKTFKFTK